MSSRPNKKRKEQNEINTATPYNVLNDKKILDFRQTVLEEIHFGPLPHPDILKRYGDIIENGAERIFSQFEKQTNHRISMERLGTIGGVIVYLLGFVIIIVLIVFAYKLSVANKSGLAVTMIGSAAGIVLAFYGLTKGSNKQDE